MKKILLTKLVLKKVLVPFQFKTKVQVEGLTHIFEFHLTSYIKNMFSLDFSIKIAYISLG